MLLTESFQKVASRCQSDPMKILQIATSIEIQLIVRASLNFMRIKPKKCQVDRNFRIYYKLFKHGEKYFICAFLDYEDGEPRLAG